MKINNITKTETYIQLDCEDNVQYLMPASATIFVDDNSNAISVKTTGSRKTIGYVISGGTPPVPPTPTGETTYTVTLTGTMPKADNVSIYFGSNIQTVTGLGEYSYTTSADSISVNITMAGQETYTYTFNPSLPLTLTSGSPSISINIIEQAESEFKWKATYLDGSVVSEECHGVEVLAFGMISLDELVFVEIGNCVTTVGNAFFSCNSITGCTIPDSVTNIGNYTFYNCISVTNITINAVTPPMLGEYVFDNTPIADGTGTIYVPAESVDAYKAAENWSSYADRIQPIP